MDQFGEEMKALLPPDLVPTRSDSIANSGPAAASDIDVPFTPSAKRVIDRCAENADKRSPESLLTEDLLDAILATPECAAAKLISEHGWTTDELLTVLQFILGKETVPATPAGSPSPRLERVIIRAKREAFRHHHPEVSSLHLLWALIRERSGIVTDTLDRPAAEFNRVANSRQVRFAKSD